MNQLQWHAVTVDESVQALHTDVDQGLTADESSGRLEKHGPNALTESKGTTALSLFIDQFKNVLVIILLVAVVLSGMLGHAVEAWSIGIIVMFSVLLGFFQEYRAEKVMESLKSMAAPTATVVRDGEDIEIPAKDLVPGDIVLLTAGDRVPADCRIIESVNLQTDESPLTGESLPVSKHAEPLDKDIATADKHNMVFSGTAVTYGRGKALVTATGMKTEFGKIAELLQNVETEQTPLQKNLDKVGKTLVKGSLVIVSIIAAIGYARGESLLDVIIFGIALAVAVVPEALPAVVTISLAISVQRMVKRNALVRRQPVVETLGSTTIICTDKTGTLTKNAMTVRQIFTAGTTYDVSGIGYKPEGTFSVDGKEVEPSESLVELLQGGVLCSDARLKQEKNAYVIKGDPTEGGIVVAAAKAGITRGALEKSMSRIHEIPFTSETKRMTTLHELDDASMAYVKGAPEVILAACDRQWGTDKELPLGDEEREYILSVAKSMAANALRVIAVARKGTSDIEDTQSGMKFLGLFGMIDPPRPEAEEAVKRCKKAGIEVMMITGDHPVTAEAIAKELGIMTDERVVLGSDIDDMSDEEFDRAIDSIAVCARVSPEHKLRVVTTLQKKGEIVAMTGDGVNDAPALKKADIGVAMGITGTDVSKEAAAMTLIDDNFASIVSAVEEGRGIFDNIKKYLIYLLSANLGEVALMTFATLLGWPLPLTATQILYVNLVTDGFPALALAVDPHESDLMDRPPRDPRKSIFNKGLLLLLIVCGACLTVATLGLFGWALWAGKTMIEASTLCFITLILIEFLMAYSLRSERRTLLQQPFSNKWLNWSIVLQMPLLFMILYVPFFHEPFDIMAPTLSDWMIVIPVALATLPALELAKYVVRKNNIIL